MSSSTSTTTVSSSKLPSKPNIRKTRLFPSLVKGELPTLKNVSDLILDGKIKNVIIMVSFCPFNLYI